MKQASKKNDKKFSQLFLVILGTIITGCSSGGSVDSGNSNSGNLSSLEFFSPYELASFESSSGNGYVVVSNTDESRSVNNISYNLNSILGGGSNVSIDSKSAESCAVLNPQEDCVLKLNLTIATRGGSFVIGATNDNFVSELKQLFSTSNSGVSSRAPIGVKQMIVSDESGVDGVKLSYYPVIGSHSRYVLIVAVVTSDKVGIFNNVVLLDKDNQPLKGQRVISGNSGPGAVPLKLGDSVSILMPVSFIIDTSPFEFKLAILDISASGATQFKQVSSQINSIRRTQNAILYNYPSSIILSPENSQQNIAVANIGDVDASNYSILSSNPSLATVSAFAITEQGVTKTIAQSAAIPAGYSVSLTDPANPVNQTFSINQSYFNGESTVNLITSATSSTVPWPQPVPTPSPSPSPAPSPTPVSCVWREVGNASSFFGQLSKGRDNIGAPMILSKDEHKLYVGGYINYESGGHPGVAEIDVTDGTSWTSVADSESLFADSLQLSRLNVLTSNENVLYLGGQSGYDGEWPTVYSSVNGGDWQAVQNLGNNLGNNNVRYYLLTSLVLVDNTLYTSGYYNGNSFVAASYNDGEWSNVGNSPEAFNGKSIYTLLYRNLVLYAGGESNQSSGSALYQYNGSGWGDISPQLPNAGAITTLTASDLAMYAGGVLSDYSGAMILSLPFTDGGQWLNISEQIGSGWINSLQLNNDKLYAGGYIESRVISTPTNSSVNWTAVWDATNQLDGPVANIVVSSDGTVYADGEFSQKVAKLVCE